MGKRQRRRLREQAKHDPEKQAELALAELVTGEDDSEHSTDKKERRNVTVTAGTASASGTATPDSED